MCPNVHPCVLVLDTKLKYPDCLIYMVLLSNGFAEYKYLGIVVKRGLNFKVNVHQNKVKFFRTFNALFAKTWFTKQPGYTDTFN